MKLEEVIKECNDTLERAAEIDAQRAQFRAEHAGYCTERLTWIHDTFVDLIARSATSGSEGGVLPIDMGVHNIRGEQRTVAVIAAAEGMDRDYDGGKTYRLRVEALRPEGTQYPLHLFGTNMYNTYTQGIFEQESWPPSDEEELEDLDGFCELLAEVSERVTSSDSWPLPLEMRQA